MPEEHFIPRSTASVLKDLDVAGTIHPLCREAAMIISRLLRRCAKLEQELLDATRYKPGRIRML